MQFRQAGFCVIAAAVSLGASLSRGEVRTWTGPGRDWFTASNWVDAALQPGAPAAGDTVRVGAGASILLTNETPGLAAFTMSGGTLTFSNWFTRLQAQTVTLTGGTLTLPPAFSETEMSNRVWIVCDTDFHLGTNAMIDVAGRGYAAGEGPGAASSAVHGGSHGGRGGRGTHGEFGVGEPAYGITNAPALPGSGGRLNSQYGARKNTGGGVVLIQAEGRLSIDGVVDADGKGDPHYYLGAGAGGSIHLVCGTFAGTSNGLLRARGGSAAVNNDPRGGAGAGGRIAVNYAQADPACAVRFSAPRGLSWLDYLGREDDKWWVAAEDGTLWLPDLALLPQTLDQPRFDRVRIYIGAGVAAWNVDALTISQNKFALSQPGFKVFVTNAAVIGSGAQLTLGSVGAAPLASLTAKGLTLSGGGSLAIFSGSDAGQGFGAEICVSNALSIGAGSWVIPYAHPYDGATVRCKMETLDIAAGGGINAHGRGYAYGHGDGRTTKAYTGAGYGGRGGIRQSRSEMIGGEGLPYGSVASPRKPGSGVMDAYYGRAYGGGAIWLEVQGTATIDGTLDAEGGRSYHYYIGGASGGAIYLKCGIFAGSASGLLNARGGTVNSYYCPGGGGRIAVDYTALAPDNAVRFSAAPGSSAETHTALDRHWWWLAAQEGTLWLPDTRLLTPTLANNRFSNVRLVIPGLTHWQADALELRDVSFALETEDGARIPVTVTNEIVLNNARLDGVERLNCGGGVTITNGSRLGVAGAAIAGSVRLAQGAGLLAFAGATNGVDQTHGAEVRIGGSLALASNAWVYPFCDAANGGAPRFFVRDLDVDETSGFNADSRGFRGGSGPAYSPNAYLGAGHGGSGGRSTFTTLLPKSPCGNPYAPVVPGSGTLASYQYGIARGGGVIWIEAADTIRMDGTMRADGASAVDFHTYPGSGAGGGILLAARRFKGALGASILANGGSSGVRGGGGGGGRIALVKRGQRSPVDELLKGGLPPGVRPTSKPASFDGLLQAAGGAGQADINNSTNPDDYAQDGSIRYLEGPADGTVLLVR